MMIDLVFDIVRWYLWANVIVYLIFLLGVAIDLWWRNR